MDTIGVADYGTHTVKHACLSLSDKNSLHHSRICENKSRAIVNDDVDVTQLGDHLAEIFCEQCSIDSDLTIALLLDSLLPQRKKELILKCCFEFLDAKRVFLGYSAAAALFSVGEITGLSVDIGYRAVRISPVLDGVVQTYLSEDVRGVGARNADIVLCQHLREPTEPLLQVLKSTACFIGDKKPAIPQNLTLPDGHSVPFPLCPDVCGKAGRALLFHAPSISVPDVLQYTYQKLLLNHGTMRNWTLFGGASSTFGLSMILVEGMNGALFPTTDTISLLQGETPQHAAISGGMILSQLSSFKNMSVDVQEYAEQGPHRCIHSKATDGR